jgi:beta-fructofuranosidase
VALKLAGQWVWDSWFVRDGDDFHVFYLQASRGLGDPERRHRNVTVGHAVSKDLTQWQVLPDALTPSEPASATTAESGQRVFDSYTTWTGSVVHDQNGTWRMFYTGTSREDAGAVQSIGLATSRDLVVWHKHSSEAILRADKSMYSVLADGRWPDEGFRDPWVFKLDGDERWHMLMTARGRDGEYGQSGVAGHAVSDDLTSWSLLPPLNAVNQGFGETEVLQFEIVDGVPVILFCCGPQWLSQERLQNESGGVYSLVVDPELQDVDFSRAVLFDAPGLYASRLIRDAQGCWQLIGFLNYVDGSFVGELSDPIAVTADPVRGLIRKS